MKPEIKVKTNLGNLLWTQISEISLGIPLQTQEEKIAKMDFKLDFDDKLYKEAQKQKKVTILRGGHDRYLHIIQSNPVLIPKFKKWNKYTTKTKLSQTVGRRSEQRLLQRKDTDDQQ